MPTDHGLRTNNAQGSLPVGPYSLEAEPKKSVGGSEVWSLGLSLQDVELMPERQVLKQELFTVLEGRNQGPQQHGDDVKHRPGSVDASRWVSISQYADGVFATDSENGFKEYSGS